jgi:zinc protease
MTESLLTTLPTQRHHLANGLTVLVREDRSAPVVAIVTHVRAGYFDEPDALIGISHVLEHMYFKGTQRRRPGDMARETKSVGGFLNAGTIYDRTSYYTVLPSSALEQGLDIQSDALLHSEIDEDELRRELVVIIEEAKRKLDSAAAVAQESLFEAMFDVHRIRRWRIGTEEVLRRLTRADVWTYYRNLYRPANVILVIAGDVDTDAACALAERYYGAMPAGDVVRDTAPAEPPRRGFRYREMAGDVVHSRIEWGWQSPDALHPDTPALDLLAVILGQGRASRLYRSVRERGLVSAASAYNYTPSSVGVFGISAELRPEDTHAALAAMARAVESIRASAPRPAELERARNMLEARLIRRTETVQGQANLLAEWEALGDWRLIDEYLARLLTLGAEDVRGATQRTLDPERATLLLYRPESAASLDADSPALYRTLFPTQLSVARPQPDFVEDGVHAYTTSNGVRILIEPRRSSSLVSASICLRGGALFEPAGSAGVSALVARVSVKGTEQRTGAQLAEEMEGIGGSLAPSAGSDAVEWAMTVPSRHFADGFALLADAALAPVFPGDEVERERKVALSDLEQVRDDMAAYPLRLLLQAAFEGHPYGTSLDAVEAAVRALDRATIAAWHERTVLRGSPWIVIVGAVDPDAAAALVAERMAAIAPCPLPEPPPPVGWPAAALTRSEQRQKAQTGIALGFPGLDRNDPDIYALQLLSVAIAGLGGRLFEELRSRRSLAYSVSAYPIARWRGGAFIGTIGTSPERADEARAALLHELLQCAQEPLSAEEVERAQRYSLGAWQIRRQTNRARLNDLADAFLLGGGLDEIRAFEANILDVTPARIRDTAARLFDADRVVTGMVRGSGGSR